VVCAGLFGSGKSLLTIYNRVCYDLGTRFEVVYVQKRAGEKIKIIRDKETGISYLFAQDGDGAGMVPMNMKVELVNDLLKAVTKGR